MAKKRKTRQEKIISDLRRKLETQALYENNSETKSSATTPVAPTNLYSLPELKPSSVYTMNHEPRTQSYTYVLSDLRKTGILTIIAIASQLVLYLVLSR